jgi:hypothetical protein
MSKSTGMPVRDELKGLIRQASLQRRSGTVRAVEKAEPEVIETVSDLADIRVDVVWRPEMARGISEGQAQNSVDVASAETRVSSHVNAEQHQPHKESAKHETAATQQSSLQHINVVNSGPAVIVRRNDISAILESAYSKSSPRPGRKDGEQEDEPASQQNSGATTTPQPRPDTAASTHSGTSVRRHSAHWNHDLSSSKNSDKWDAVMKQPFAAQLSLTPNKDHQTAERTSPLGKMSRTMDTYTEKIDKVRTPAMNWSKRSWASTNNLPSRTHGLSSGSGSYQGFHHSSTSFDIHTSGNTPSYRSYFASEDEEAHASPILRAMRQRAVLEGARHGNMLHAAMRGQFQVGPNSVFPRMLWCLFMRLNMGGKAKYTRGLEHDLGMTASTSSTVSCSRMCVQRILHYKSP